MKQIHMIAFAAVLVVVELGGVLLDWGAGWTMFYTGLSHAWLIGSAIVAAIDRGRVIINANSVTMADTPHGDDLVRAAP